MKQMKKYSTVYIALSCVFNLSISAQEAVFVNKNGILSVSSTGILSTLYTFENIKEDKEKVTEGVTIQNGTAYYYKDFINKGDYYHNDKAKQSTAVFTRYNKDQVKQVISGESLSTFHHVILDNTTDKVAFDLQSQMDVTGSVEFKDGIVLVDSLKGMLSFLPGAQAINPTDNSHAEGFVEKVGSESFQYPKGDGGLYRYARISAPSAANDVYLGKYIWQDKSFFKVRAAKSGVINLLNEREYWIIEKGGNNSREDILLTLSWDERTTPEALLVDPEEELHIVRWNELEQMWVDEGGIVDVASKEITTPTSVRGYGFFTLATIKKEVLLEGDIVIYNLVTPNGDGKNDYFIIDNIDRFPENTVQIFNRWGVKVYETSSYNSKGNVFRGISEGRVTWNKDAKLPSGTYFYVVTYTYKDKKGNSSSIKKSGPLHLENH